MKNVKISIASLLIASMGLTAFGQGKQLKMTTKIPKKYKYTG